MGTNECGTVESSYKSWGYTAHLKVGLAWFSTYIGELLGNMSILLEHCWSVVIGMEENGGVKI